MGFKEDWKKYSHYLNTDPEAVVDPFVLVIDNLTTPTKQLIATELTPALDSAKLLHYESLRSSIRQFGAELPATDPLRKAIEAVAGHP